MCRQSELDECLGYLCEGLRHSARETSLVDYCRALMLPLKRKSVEPLAASVDPRHVRAKHQSLHHVVAQSSWSERGLLARALDWVVAKMANSRIPGARNCALRQTPALPEDYVPRGASARAGPCG